MLFHQQSHFKLYLQFKATHITRLLTTFLIAGLLGIHLILLAVGTFCASATINSDPVHHPGHESSTSSLCEWACHVGQIAASATPTEDISVLLILVILSIIHPTILLSVFHPFSFASPRGPPLF